MYTCRVCDRTYQSRGSLTRHLRNHSVDSSHHVCPICDVAFSRRDLLRRHYQIHQSENLPVSPSPGSEITKSAPRRRCHTACQRCREARIKCNGEHPCAQCVSSQTECQFRALTHRVSRVVEMEAAQEHRSNPNYEDSGSEGEIPPESQPEGALPVAPDMPQSPVSNINSPNMAFLGPAQPILELDQIHRMPPIDQMAEMDFSWAGTVPCNTGSWPWLHESLFLQGNPMLNWPNDFGSSLIDQSNIIQDSGFNILPDGPAPPSASRTVSSPTQGFTFGTPITAITQTENQIPSEQERIGRSHQPHISDVFDSKGQMALQDKIVHELVAYAGDQTLTPGSQMSRAFYWQSISIRIAEAFKFDSWPSGQPELSLNRMMDMYKENFSPLWPLLSGKEFDPTHLHPLLFLTVISIGCMYGGERECKFGNMLHEHIRRHLAVSLIGLEDGEGDILWLGQARLLTQVAALYFGQRRAFSYAQHLGAVVIAQARRMDLFSTLGSGITGGCPIEQQVDAWHKNESRKRLAFGILRADVFASVLLNTRPLLSAEEIYLDFPTDDEIWGDLNNTPLDQLVARLKAEAPKALGLPFCDVVRVAEDRGETLLNMNARGYELLIFGLQNHVWRFSHDRSIFPRLTGQSDGIVTQNYNMRSSAGGRLSISASSQSDQLGLTYRQMNDLRDDRVRITETLQRWEQSFTATRTTQTFAKERSSVMSSMLLLHISYLRLCAPLADLHSAAYTLMDKKSLDEKKLQALHNWARGPEATQAVESVRHVWSLLHHEINRDGPEKAKYNLLAFSSLHHAAVVIWAIAGAHPEYTEETPELPGSKNIAPIPIHRGHNKSLLRTVVSLYQRLIPRGWYSFATAAEYMAAHPFPTCNK
ncbi:hypothetical protein N7536_001355 [Penicillium majusculum]|nr:hypothetical protein N7536_001355 [Penicillium majusculum]